MWTANNELLLSTWLSSKLVIIIVELFLLYVCAGSIWYKRFYQTVQRYVFSSSVMQHIDSWEWSQFRKFMKWEERGGIWIAVVLCNGVKLRNKFVRSNMLSCALTTNFWTPECAINQSFSWLLNSILHFITFGVSLRLSAHLLEVFGTYYRFQYLYLWYSVWECSLCTNKQWNKM